MAAKISSPLRWLHLTRPAASTRYVYIFEHPDGFYKQVTRRIGYLDAIMMVGGVTTSKHQPQHLNSLLWLQPFGMAPSLHVLPNEHDEAYFPVLQSPFRRSEPWWCRALCSEPDRLQHGGLMSFKRPDDVLTPLDSQIRKQGRWFSHCLLAAPPLSPQHVFFAMQREGFFPVGLLTHSGPWEGLVVLVDAPSKSFASVGEVPGIGWLAYVPGASICEIDHEGTLSVWSLDERDIHEVGHGRVEVGRVVPAALEQASSSDGLQTLLEETFPSDGRLHEFTLTYFPQVGRKFTNTMGRQKRLQLLLASVPHERIRAAAMKERRAREAW